MDKSVEELRKLGNEKFRALNYGAALMYYTQALDKDSNNYALYYNRAVTFVKMDNIEEAKEDLLKSLKIKPNYIPSLCQLGFVYLYQGNTPDSLESYVSAIKASESLPHQLNRFKAQLKEAIRLAESRCRQQEYPDSFINEIITPEIRDILNGYPNLPTHMIESGIPSVSFGNVPIAHHANSIAPNATIIASGAIPLPVRTRNRNRAVNSFTSSTLTNGTTTDTTNSISVANATTPITTTTTTIAQTNNVNDILSHIPGLNNLLNTAGGTVTASIDIQELPSNYNGDAHGSNNNENNETTNNDNDSANANSNETRQTPVIIHPISSNPDSNDNNTHIPVLDFISRHRAAHESAVNRATELRRQREQERRDREERQRTSAVNSEPIQLRNTAGTSAIPSAIPSGIPSAIPSPIPTATANTTHGGVDFARQIASMVATQFAGGNNNTGEPPSLAQNLATIASGVLGGIANANPNTSANTSDNANTNTGNHSADLDDLDMDLD